MLWRSGAYALAILLVPAISLAMPLEYQVDAARSRIVVYVKSTGLAAPLLHDHTFVVTSHYGTLGFDFDRPSLPKVRMTMRADSLRDHESALSAKDRAKVDRQARTSILRADSYPEIRLVADRLLIDRIDQVKRGLDGTLVGYLELRGIAREIRVPFSATWIAGGVRVIGRAKLRQSNFGIKPYRAFLGTVRVRDQVEVEFEILLRAR